MAIRITLEYGHASTLRVRSTRDHFTHDWEVFVRGIDNADIHQYIEKVVFQLHKTFKKPMRVLKEPPFVIKESGYAGFIIPIHIYLRNKDCQKKFVIYYDLHLQKSGPAINKVMRHCEIINNPSEEFRKKLLKGGAVVISSTGDILEKSETKALPMVGKPKLGASETKKHRLVETKAPNSFVDLFGQPITKSTKISPDSKKNIQSEKNANPKPALVTEKTDKGEKCKSKDSPHKEGKKEKIDDKKHRSSKDSKEKNKNREKLKRSSSPGSKSHTSPSRKRSSSPIPAKKPSSPMPPFSKRSVSPKIKEKEFRRGNQEREEKDKEQEKEKESERGKEKEKDKDKDKIRELDRGEKEKQKDVDKDRDRERNREKEREKEIDYENENRKRIHNGNDSGKTNEIDNDVENDKEKDKDKSRDRDNEKDKEKDRGREWEREKERAREKEKEKMKEMERDQEKQKDKDKEKERDKGKEKENLKDKDKDHLRDKEKDNLKEKDKEHMKDNEKEKHKEKHKERDREKDRDKSKEKEKDRDKLKENPKSSIDLKREKKKEKKRHKEDKDKIKKDKHKEVEKICLKEVKSGDKKLAKIEKMEKSDKEKSQEHKTTKEDSKSPRLLKDNDKFKEEKLSKIEKLDKSEKPEKMKEGKSDKDKQKYKHKRREKKDKRDSSKESEKKEKRDKTKSHCDKQILGSATLNPLSTLIAEMPERDSSDSTPSMDDESFTDQKIKTEAIMKTDIESMSTVEATVEPSKLSITNDVKKEKTDRVKKEKCKERESRKRKRKSESKIDDEILVKRDKDVNCSTSPLLEPVSSSQSPVVDTENRHFIKDKEDRSMVHPSLQKNTEADIEQVAPDSTNCTLVESDIGESPMFSDDYVSQLKDLQHKIMTLQDNQELQRVVQVIAETGQYEITKKTFDFDLCALDRRTVQRLQQFFSAS